LTKKPSGSKTIKRLKKRIPQKGKKIATDRGGRTPTTKWKFLSECLDRGVLRHPSSGVLDEPQHFNHELAEYSLCHGVCGFVELLKAQCECPRREWKRLTVIDNDPEEDFVLLSSAICMVRLRRGKELVACQVYYGAVYQLNFTALSILPCMTNYRSHDRVSGWI